ncbi:MAG: Mrp/NBP35 family ATP-binding protein [Elusimicrobiales bacterium]|nr:Mrp/NBP35 family ATP-binding protein [Elusimicrobiales bacterium]
MHKIDVDDSVSRIKENMAKIRNKILIMSNKGGVGKSSIAVNIAAALNASGHKVGLLDIDVHGPSLAKMTGQEGKTPNTDGKTLEPIEVKENFKMMSMGSLMPQSEEPLIWRGPLKIGLIKQFLSDVQWGDLDYLIIDAPPGTGDEPLSICQLLPEMTGGIIVTTGQDIALLDSKKAVNFLKKLKIGVLGIIENMTTFQCPHCAKEINLFKSGGGERAANDLNVDFLGRVPFDSDMMEAEDKGELFIEKFSDSPCAKVIKEAVEKISEQLKVKI